MAFVDESGVKSPCSCVVLAAVVAQTAGSYIYWGIDVLSEIKRAAGLTGEAKWRLVKRRGAADFALSALGRLEGRWAVVHYTDRRSFEVELWKFLTSIQADLYVLDEGIADPSKFPRAIARASHKVPGIQLADLLAGSVADRTCKRKSL